MTAQKKHILHGFFNANSVFQTILLSVIAYFLLDLHTDFKGVKQVVQTHEVLLQVHSTQLADIKISFQNLNPQKP